VRRRRLYAPTASAEADVRPTLLGVVTLLFLLLFFLLGTSSGQKLAVIGLRSASAEGLAPLPHSGLRRALRVEVTAGGDVVVRSEVQTTDISASATSTASRAQPIPARGGAVDRAGLGTVLAALHAADPAQRRATVTPTDDVRTDALISVLDTVRGPANAWFPEVSLQDAEPTP